MLPENRKKAAKSKVPWEISYTNEEDVSKKKKKKKKRRMKMFPKKKKDEDDAGWTLTKIYIYT